MARTFTISDHAVRQYRQRAVLCCERSPSDVQLRGAMAAELERLPWRLVGGETFVCEAGPLLPTRFHKRTQMPGWKINGVTHAFVIERQWVLTVLGFMMRTSREKNRRKRHRRFMREARAA